MPFQDIFSCNRKLSTFLVYGVGWRTFDAKT